MLASVALPESAKVFVTARCVNRMGLGTSSDNTNFTQLDTALPLAGELTSSRRRQFTPTLTRAYALTLSRSYAHTLSILFHSGAVCPRARRDLAARLRVGKGRRVALCAQRKHADRLEWLRRPW
eukprot:scaffold22990_cov82-Phaeocystis_antarctica.AAC.2